MKSVKLYMPNGEEKDYPQVLNHNTENGLLAFRYEEVPGDRTTIKKVITNLPFLTEQAKRNILGLNAARLFGFEVPPNKLAKVPEPEPALAK